MQDTTSAAATRTTEAVREGLTRVTALDEKYGVSKNLQAGVASGFEVVACVAVITCFSLVLFSLVLLRSSHALLSLPALV